MHNHFDQHLNVKEIILSRRPKIIVECGAASGENTRQIISLMEEYPFKLFSVSDAPYAEETMKITSTFPNLNGNFTWVYDLSYRFLNNFKGQIDLLSIDTDHNYWTMKEELEAACNKISVGGVIVIHDTETYRKNSGKALRYGTGDIYPCSLIDKYEKEGLGMGDAIYKFLSNHHDFRIMRESLESHGAMALEKKC